MSKRKYEPGAFIPCSPKHKSCSPAHAQLVAGYRAERERQLVLFEAETGGYEGDKKIWLENHTLINFKTWLIANKTATNKSATNEKICIVKQEDFDKIFNQMTEGFTMKAPVENAVPTDTAISNTNVEGTQNEEECHCDCDFCCRNDHAACTNDFDPCCLCEP